MLLICFTDLSRLYRTVSGPRIIYSQRVRVGKEKEVKLFTEKTFCLNTRKFTGIVYNDDMTQIFG